MACRWSHLHRSVARRVFPSSEAFVYAFVLEGTMRSKVDDTPASTYRQGENWVEQPGAHHVLRENTSQSERAARVQ
jgi:quercetin dioxygenase-like cupin family protein